MLDTFQIATLKARVAALEVKLTQLETDAVLLDTHRMDDSMTLQSGDSNDGTTIFVSQQTDTSGSQVLASNEAKTADAGTATAATLSQANTNPTASVFCATGTNYSASSADFENTAEVDIRATANETASTYTAGIELNGTGTSISFGGTSRTALVLGGSAGNPGDALLSGGATGLMRWRSPGVSRYFFRTFTAATNTINTSAGPIRFNLTGGNWHIVNNSTDILYCRVLTNSLLGLGNGTAFTVSQGGDSNINNVGIGVQIVSAHMYGDIVTAATSTLVIAGFTDVLNE